MRTFRLAKVAAQAEGLRLRRMARRLVMRAVYMAVAALFGLGALVLLHAIGWLLLSRVAGLGAIWATVIVFAVDLVIAVVFLVLGRGSPPDLVETEAKVVRDRSLAEMRNVVTLAALFGPAGRMAGRGAFGLGRRFIRGKRR